MDTSDWLIGVVVPARDEEGTIENCITAIRTALARNEEFRASWIVVVADSCTDQTVSRARAAMGGAGEVVECSARSAGGARRCGAEALLRKAMTYRCSRVWIANTDADSEPTADWIHQQLVFAEQGIVGVAGIVRVRSIAGLHPDEIPQLLSDYATNTDGTHSHVHGANLGIRADAYLAVGGWSTLALAEDHCLWSRLRASGWRTVSSTRSVVITSGRVAGRATGGFADGLRRRLELRHV
jgi:cellulose synthase/poly-beta-1,6-N-acetylglucosamine synthase-like glycosyltransferase